MGNALGHSLHLCLSAAIDPGPGLGLGLTVFKRKQYLVLCKIKDLVSTYLLSVVATPVQLDHSHPSVLHQSLR